MRISRLALLRESRLENKKVTACIPRCAHQETIGILLALSRRWLVLVAGSGNGIWLTALVARWIASANGLIQVEASASLEVTAVFRAITAMLLHCFTA